MAREAGCRARVYMSRTRRASARIEAIQSEGAEVVLVDGSYDEAVRRDGARGRDHGWTVISDTSWPGYSEIPRLIMLGYTRLMDEDWAVRAIAPELIFVPAGVGGLLGGRRMLVRLRATVAFVRASSQWNRCPRRASRCRPETGSPTTVPGPFETAMGGLRCGEMSPDVFPVVAFPGGCVRRDRGRLRVRSDAPARATGRTMTRL